MQLRPLQDLRHQSAASGHQLDDSAGRRRSQIRADLDLHFVVRSQALDLNAACATKLGPVYYVAIPCAVPLLETEHMFIAYGQSIKLTLSGCALHLCARRRTEPPSSGSVLKAINDEWAITVSSRRLHEVIHTRFWLVRGQGMINRTHDYTSKCHHVDDSLTSIKLFYVFLAGCRTQYERLDSPRMTIPGVLQRPMA